MYNPLTKDLLEKKEMVVKTGNLLNSDPDIQYVAIGHCTGKDVYNILKDTLGNKLLSLNAESRFSF